MKEKQMKNQEMEGEKQMKQIEINERGFSEEKMKRLNEHGITLVALVVTIIILLILAGVAIRIALGENGLFSMSRNATGKYKQAQTNEEQELQATEKEFKKLTQGLTVTATVNGKEEDITKDNFGKYLGMEVTNFKELGSGIEKIKVADADIDDESEDVTVSTTYRLYYIDFDNKYKEGAGTIYLKADYYNSIRSLQVDEHEANDEKEKIKQLNPCLYEEGKKAPSGYNMKAVAWLLNTDRWSVLKSNLKEGVLGKVNYIVGAPSLEIMIDSYNVHYGLTGEEPVSGNIEEVGNSKKLFYKYNNGEKGYQVKKGSSEEYSTRTGIEVVQIDENIGSMYFPYSGTDFGYWLASPSPYESNITVKHNTVYCVKRGLIESDSYEYNVYTRNGKRAFCPLVSLKPSFELELKNGNE